MTMFIESNLAQLHKNLDLSYLSGEQVKTKEKNNYTEKSSLDFEMPRLMAQARTVFKNLSSYFSLLSPLFLEKGKFLDVGAGPGLLTSLILEEYFPKLKGMALEPSDYMFQFGSVFCSEIDWTQGTVYDMPYETESVDFVFSSFVFMHLSDPQKALSEVFRVLKKGGMFFVLNTDYYNTHGSSPFFF